MTKKWLCYPLAHDSPVMAIPYVRLNCAAL